MLGLKAKTLTQTVKILRKSQNFKLKSRSCEINCQNFKILKVKIRDE